jgi:hypothetical protein
MAVVGEYIGPAREVLIRRVCAAHDLPFDAVTYEHVGGLAVALGTEARPFIGENAAGRLTRAIEALLTNPA